MRLPDLDSPACFAALLGCDDEHGRWLPGPVEEAKTHRHHLRDSLVRETVPETDVGSGLAGPLGLYAEKTASDGAMYGNFPQAFSHLGLVTAACDLQAPTCHIRN